MTQREAAVVYALCLQLFPPSSDIWPILNHGVMAMWPSESGLESVKKMAWSMFGGPK